MEIDEETIATCLVTKTYGKSVLDEILSEYSEMINSLSSSAFEPVQKEILNSTGKAIDVDKASDMFKSILKEKICKQFKGIWEDLDLSTKLDELKAAKEAANKETRPTHLEVKDQVKAARIKALLKRKKILEGQVNYQNRILEENLIPMVEQKRNELRKMVDQHEKILHMIQEDEKDLDDVEAKMKQKCLAQ